jgi:hypothetical protein
MAVLVAGLLLLGGCSRTAVDPVQQLLDGLVAAAGDRDADAFVAHLGAGFRGQAPLATRAEALNEVRRLFRLYDSIEVTPSNVQVERQAASANVTLRADFAGRAKQLPSLEGLLPRASAFQFRLVAVPQGDVWVVSEASWERVALPPGP